VTAKLLAVPRQSARQPRVERWEIGAVLVSRLHLSSKGSTFTLHISPEDLCVLLPMVGRSTLDHEGLTCRLPAGQLATLEVQQVHVQPEAIDTQLLILRIPRKCLATDILATSSNPQPRLHVYSSRVLSRTLRVFAASRHRYDELTAERISTLLCRVVEHTIREQYCADRRTQRAASSAYAKRLGRAYRYIRQHVDRSHLSLDDIAKDAGCTVRYVQKMFAPGGESVREFILHLRLELVHCDLLSSRLWSRPVTEIALAHGFNNASHFTRKYRGHFGITPSALRFVHQTVSLQWSEWKHSQVVATTHRDESV
jgi:AraC-like DNA-binding protein